MWLKSFRFNHRIPADVERYDNMNDMNFLKNKKILIVDDELDVLETLEEILDTCEKVDTASNFDKAVTLIRENDYDAVILDIMGVNGYQLLDITIEKNIPALMLTAHAFSPDHLIEAVKKGALFYVPKEKISDIAEYLVIAIKEYAEKKENGKVMGTLGKGFIKLKPIYDKKFGSDWEEKYSKDLE